MDLLDPGPSKGKRTNPFSEARQGACVAAMSPESQAPLQVSLGREGVPFPAGSEG